MSQQTKRPSVPKEFGETLQRKHPNWRHLLIQWWIEGSMTARFYHLWTKKNQHWKPTAHHMLEERLLLTVCVTMSQLKCYKRETLSERCYAHHQTPFLSAAVLFRYTIWLIPLCSNHSFYKTTPPQRRRRAKHVAEVAQWYLIGTQNRYNGTFLLSATMGTKAWPAMEYQNVPFSTECVCVLC